MALEYKFDQKGNATLQVDTPSKRSYCWLIFILSWLLVIGAGSYLYYSGYLTPASLDSKQNILQSNLRGRLNEQERLLETQTDTIRVLEAELATAQRAKKIQDEANHSLRRQLGALEVQLLNAKRKSVLYESILSPDEVKTGLRIQHFSIRPIVLDKQGESLPKNIHFNYHLVLAHVRNQISQPSKGTFKIQIIGVQDNKEKSLVHTDLGNTDQAVLKDFSLKYYQSLEGGITLPIGFEPKQVKVTLKPTSGKAIHTEYAWEELNKTVNNTVTSKE